MRDIGRGAQEGRGLRVYNGMGRIGGVDRTCVKRMV